jgi:hypothetical protein
MNRVPTSQKLQLTRWNFDWLGLQINKSAAQAHQVLRIGQNGKISVATKLGRAVKHACLAAHQ